MHTYFLLCRSTFTGSFWQFISLSLLLSSGTLAEHISLSPPESCPSDWLSTFEFSTVFVFLHFALVCFAHSSYTCSFHIPPTFASLLLHRLLSLRKLSLNSASLFLSRPVMLCFLHEYFSSLHPSCSLYSLCSHLPRGVGSLWLVRSLDFLPLEMCVHALQCSLLMAVVSSLCPRGEIDAAGACVFARFCAGSQGHKLFSLHHEALTPPLKNVLTDEEMP